MGYGDYLLSYLHEIGFALSGGLGMEPLSYTEIHAWRDLTATPLEPWEALALQTLSSEYLIQYKLSENPSAPAPFIGGSLEVRRKETTSFFKNLRAQYSDRHSNAKR